MGLSLVSAVIAVFSLARQTDIKRLFAYSSIEHMGLTTFAFGLGGPTGPFAAFLYVTVHSRSKSAIFSRSATPRSAGSQRMDRIRGLIHRSPTVGWGLMLGTLGILGLPPFGVFTSEFLIITTTIHAQSWATPVLLVSLAIAFAGVFGKVQPRVFGSTDAPAPPHPPALVPIFTQMALVLHLGLYIPPFLVQWYQRGVVYRLGLCSHPSVRRGTRTQQESGGMPWSGLAGAAH